MDADNRKIILKSPLAREYAEWWSLWFDLLSARQALFDRKKVANKPSNTFGRRAMWDGAVVAYCRCFKTGRQRALLGPMLDGLSRRHRKRHDEAMHWRDKHIAHRVDKKLETVTITAVVDFRDKVVQVEGSVTTSTSPSEQDIAVFADLVDLLKDRVWRERLIPLERALADELVASGEAQSGMD